MKTPEPSSLRQVAEELDRYEGYRVEIIGGTLVMSPSPRLKHGRILTKLQVQLEARMPAELASAQGESVTSPEHGEDYTIPDLIVYPESYERSEEWAVPGQDVELAVEVVSVSNVGRDTVDKLKWYAAADMACYLLIDPRNGTWSLYTEPAKRGYRASYQGKFGETIPLPDPINVDIQTDEFWRYEG